MKKFALLGKDIADSGSPDLFRAAFGGKYAYDLLDGPEFHPLFDKFLKNYDAVNVTAPFKTEAFKAADEATEAAELCGAANMLIKTAGGKILADNSDFEGVTISLMSAYSVADVVDVEDEDAFADYLAGKSALVTGCGGAGMAAAAAAVSLGYGETVLVNRTRQKACDLRQRICDYFGDIGAEEIKVVEIEDFGKAFKDADVVIYTVPEAVCDLSGLDAGGKFILESNYKTPALNKLTGKYNYISGLNWLFNQAVISYQAFTGENPDEEEMKRILR